MVAKEVSIKVNDHSHAFAIKQTDEFSTHLSWNAAGNDLVSSCLRRNDQNDQYFLIQLNYVEPTMMQQKPPFMVANVSNDS